MAAWKKEVLHFGHEAHDDSRDYEISREDNAVLIETFLETGGELNVFIHRNLFPQIYRAMKSVEERYPHPEGVVEYLELR
jgi:hypothetical protein